MTQLRTSSFVTDRPVAILMVFLAAVVFGYLSLGRLPVTLMPELTYPTLTVRTEYPGAAPEEVENDIGRPIEEALGLVGGLRKISSINRAGISDVVLEFAWDSDMSEVTQDVLEKLDRVFLPVEAERPLILHFDPSLDPILELSLAGEGRRFEGEEGLRRLRRLAELQVKRELEPVKGVAAVQVRGGLEEEIHVALDAASLRRTGIAIQQVIDRLAQENINVAGGTLQEGRIEYLVRTLNEYENLDQIRDTIVANFEGRPVKIKDLGQVSWSHREREILTRTDGHDSVQIDVFKEADANIVAVAERIRALMGDFRLPAESPEKQDEEPVAAAAAGNRGAGQDAGTGLAADLFRNEGAQLKIVADRSRFIKSSIEDVRNTAILGGVLAIAVLYLFLRNFRSTAIIAFSIPISLLVTFAPLNLMSVSLNIMSLGGLALGIGMLVDSSIVVLESIYRCREEGDDIREGAIRGTREVRSAVLASTLTSIAVFFPMVFVEGIAGQAFGDLGMAVVFSLLVSAAVALFFIPMLASRRSRNLRQGSYFSYFSTESWRLARGRYLNSSPGKQIAIAPLLGVRFLAGIYLHYVRLAWRELRESVRRAPRWYRVTNAHNWLLQALLVPLLPFAVRGLARMEAVWVQAIPEIWRELREDFSRSSLVVKLLAAPVFLLRALLALPLPYLLLIWPWPLMFRSRSWEMVRGAYRARGRAGRILFVVTVVPAAYLTVRWLLGSVLEGFGKLLLAAISALSFLCFRLAGPILGFFITGLAWLPARATDVGLRLVGGLYPRVLRSALAHPGVVVLVVGVALWATWQVGNSLDSELLPEVHQGEFTVEVALPVGTPLAETERIISPVEQAILEEQRHIDSLILTVGYDSANSTRSDEGEHTAAFKVILDEGSRNAAVEQSMISRLRERFAGIPDVDARVVRPVLFSSKTPIEVEIYGTDLKMLRQYSEQAKAVMAGLPELADVETTLRPGAPEVQIVYDRDKLSLYGLNIGEVARHVRDKVKGFEATRFNLTDRRIPVLVRLELPDRETVEDVADLVVNPGADRPIPLSSVAEVTLGEGPSEVRRVDGTRVGLIQANLADGSLSAAAVAIERALHSRIEWPAQLGFDIRGQNEEWSRSQRSLWLALGLSIFMVYVIMAMQFESLTHPFVIMLTIPLAFVGTILALKLLGLNLSVVVFLGMIMLAGIVVNNAIVLVDYINTLRGREMSRDEAILTAGSVRLRPILMTTATTVLGLLPLALGFGDGAEIRSPMAIAVISGLLTSTALTLIVIPTIYAVFDRAVAWMLGAPARASSRRTVAAALEGGDADSVTP